MTNKTALSGFALFAFALCLFGSRVVFAGNPPLPPPDAKLDWWTVDTGASGHSTGAAADVLFGSIGQHDSGDAEASSSSLAAGFLSAFDSGTIQFKHSIRYISEEISIHYVEVERVGGDYNAAQATVSVTSATATSGEYSCATTTLTWAPNEMGTKLFPITLTSADSTPEPAKSISLSLSGISGAGKGLSETEVVILDDDTPVEVLIATSGFEFNEDDGEIPVEISLSSATAMTVNVDVLTSDVTTIAFQDYVPVLTTLTFAPGETAKQISIPLIQDCSTEESEHFILGADNLVNATLHPASIDYGLTITDGEPCAIIHIANAPIHFDDFIRSGPSPVQTVVLSNFGNGPLNFAEAGVYLLGEGAAEFDISPVVRADLGYSKMDIAQISILGLMSSDLSTASVLPESSRAINIVHEPKRDNNSLVQASLCFETNATNSDLECAFISAGEVSSGSSQMASMQCAPADFAWDLHGPQEFPTWIQESFQLPRTMLFDGHNPSLNMEIQAIQDRMTEHFSKVDFKAIRTATGFALKNRFRLNDNFLQDNESFLEEGPLHQRLGLQGRLLPWMLPLIPHTRMAYAKTPLGGEDNEFLTLSSYDCNDADSKLIRMRWKIRPRSLVNSHIHPDFRLRTFSAGHTRVDFTHFEGSYRFERTENDFITYASIDKGNSIASEGQKKLGAALDIISPGDYEDSIELQSVELIHLNQSEYDEKFLPAPTEGWVCPSEADEDSFGCLISWTPEASDSLDFVKFSNGIRAGVALHEAIDVPVQKVSDNEIVLTHSALQTGKVKTGSQIYLKSNDTPSTVDGFFRITRDSNPDKIRVTTTGAEFQGFEGTTISARMAATSPARITTAPDFAIETAESHLEDDMKITLSHEMNLPAGAVVNLTTPPTTDAHSVTTIFSQNYRIKQRIDSKTLILEGNLPPNAEQGTISMAPHNVEQVSPQISVAGKIEFDPATFTLRAENSGGSGADFSFAYVDIEQNCENKYHYVPGATYRIDAKVSINSEFIKGVDKGLPSLRIRTINLPRTPSPLPDRGQLSHELWIQTNDLLSTNEILGVPTVAGTNYSLHFTVPRDYVSLDDTAIALAFDMWTGSTRGKEKANVAYSLKSLQIHRAKPIPMELIPTTVSATGSGDQVTVAFQRFEETDETDNVIHRYEVELHVNPSFLPRSGILTEELKIWKQTYQSQGTILADNLTPNTKYYARVRAIDVLDQAGSPSSTVEFTTYSLNPKVPSGPRPVPPVLNEERNHADPAALQTNYASVGSAWPLEASISDVSERTTTLGYPKNYLLGSNGGPNFFSALVAQVTYDTSDDYGISPMLLGAFFGASSLTQSRNHITRAPLRPSGNGKEAQKPIGRYLNGAELVGNILQGGTLYDRFQAIGLHSTAATAATFGENEWVTSLTALKSRVEIGGMPVTDTPLVGDTEERYDPRQFTQGRTTIGNGGWSTLIRGSSAYIYPEAYSFGDTETSWEFGSKTGSYVDKAFGRINEILGSKIEMSTSSRTQIGKVVGHQSFLNMENYMPQDVGEAGLSATVSSSSNREIDVLNGEQKRLYTGMMIYPRIGKTITGFGRPLQPVRNSLFLESQEPGSLGRTRSGSGSTVRHVTLLPGHADQRMPESTATILISDSIVVGDSHANLDKTSMNTDGLHVNGVVHLTPRLYPPQLSQDLAGYNKIGLMYYDATKNRLRVSRAAPSAGAALGEKGKSHLIWASIKIEGGAPATALPSASQHPRVKLIGVDSSNWSIHLGLEGFVPLGSISPPTVFARRKAHGVQGFGASGWETLQPTVLDDDEMTCLLPPSIWGSSGGYTLPNPGQLVEVIVIKSSHQSAGTSFPLIALGDSE